MGIPIRNDIDDKDATQDAPNVADGHPQRMLENADTESEIAKPVYEHIPTIK